MNAESNLFIVDGSGTSDVLIPVLIAKKQAIKEFLASAGLRPQHLFG